MADRATYTRLARAGAGAGAAALLLTGMGMATPAVAATGWSAQRAAAQTLRAITFADANRGWAVGDLGTIIATVDGGVTWVPQRSGTSMDLRAVSFTNASTGWTVGAGSTILATHDGGTTWSSEVAGVTTDFAPYYTLKAVSFLDDLHGLAGGNSSYLQTTTDGGATWTQLESSGHGCSSVSDFTGIQFIDAQHAVGVGGHPSGITCRTADGGQTWTATALGSLGLSSPVFGPSFVDAQNGWAVSGSYAISTADGGATWTLHGVRGAEQLRAVTFVDARTGWIVGDGGAIFATHNGGQSWNQVSSGTTADLLSAFGATSGRAWAAGASGTITSAGRHGPAIR
ncbi:MAG: WD40/YVTN/BNR-like repeat-containing protein [Candidatus Limnocylindria bacterium]